MEWLKFFVPAVVGTARLGYSTHKLRNDLFGGLTAAIVALPLALAFGVASGAGPIAVRADDRRSRGSCTRSCF